MTEVTLIPGDGTGPELVAAARRVLDATGASLEWDEHEAGEDAAASLARTTVALKGPSDPPDGGLAQGLDLFASVRPCRAYEGVRTRFPETNVVIVRENAEGTGLAFADEERILRAAFHFAQDDGRHKVTAAGEAGHAIAEEYDGIEFQDRGVGALCSRLVTRPEEYDVIALPRLYGDVASDLAAGLVGGRGLAPGVHIGPDAAVFEATHGCAPWYAGQDKVNPTALLLCGVLMLRHLGEADAGDRLEGAIAGVIRRGESVTYDLKPTRNDPSAVGTSEFADAVIEEMN